MNLVIIMKLDIRTEEYRYNTNIDKDIFKSTVDDIVKSRIGLECDDQEIAARDIYTVSCFVDMSGKISVFSDCNSGVLETGIITCFSMKLEEGDVVFDESISID